MSGSAYSNVPQHVIGWVETDLEKPKSDNLIKGIPFFISLIK